jgi:hypothetical protein
MVAAGKTPHVFICTESRLEPTTRGFRKGWAPTTLFFKGTCELTQLQVLFCICCSRMKEIARKDES